MHRHRRSTAPNLSLSKIHHAISETIEKREADKGSKKASAGDISFEDALHAIETIPRPKSSEDIQKLGEVLIAAVDAAGEDLQNWKLLVLTILRRRYHAKAPEAKKILMEEQKMDKEEDCSNIRSGDGHGERLSFYLFFMYLDILSRRCNTNVYVTQACECLARLALPAGGTRDVCALVEFLTYTTLEEAGILRIQKDQGDRAALHETVQKVLATSASSCNDKEYKPTSLRLLLKIAAKLIDEDLGLIAEMEQHQDKKVKTAHHDRTFQSTINTFIPHHNRGSKERKLVQCTAELMIWAQTSSSRTDPKFSAALTELCQNATPISSTHSLPGQRSQDKIITSIHAMQTSIRRFRKKLNSSARNQGFSLRSSFLIDPTSITLGMVRGGKEGDVKCLLSMASKAKNMKVIELINSRFSDPNKAVPISSVRDMYKNWITLPSPTNETENGEDCDDLNKLKLQMQEATVKATVEHLRKKISSTTTSRKKIIACLDNTIDSDTAAIIVAAALDSRCHWNTNDKEEGSDSTNKECSVAFFIGSELCNVSSFSLLMNLLNKTFMKERVSDNGQIIGDANADAATTKDVQNLIERHVGPNSQLILFASTDVKLEQRVLQKLQEEGSSVHCHINDDWAHRMDREKAKVGDITCTLAWDNECDLDLHAICPNGDHISYNNTVGGGKIGGGYLDVDMNANGESMEPVENIFFGDAEKGIEASHGKYKIYVQNYAYHGKTVAVGDPIDWRVRLAKNGENTEFKGQCVGKGDESNSTVVEFEYNGRKAPPPEKVGSALFSSNLVAVTSSVGGTIDSISGLMKLGEQHEELNQVRNLVSESTNETCVTATEEGDGVEDSTATEERGGVEGSIPVDSNHGIATRPLMANQNAFDITNRDRLYLNLSTLPASFVLEVNRSFQGGETLLHHTASQLAKRLIKDNIYVSELRQAGYPDNIVDIVKEKMTTFGV